MAAVATTATLGRDAIYKQELAEYQAKADKWAKMTPPAATTTGDLNAVKPRDDAYAPPAPPPKPKKKKKGCWDKTKSVFSKVVKVAVPTVMGFFTGGPVGAGIGAAKGIASL
jgi:hypothetical protein